MNPHKKTVGFSRVEVGLGLLGPKALKNESFEGKGQ